MSALATREIAAPLNLYPGFTHLALKALVPGSKAPCPIRLEAFNASLNRINLVTALEAGQRVSDNWREAMLDAEISHFYVTFGDLDHIQEYLHHQARQALADPQQREQGQVLAYESALCTMKAAMLDPRNGRRLAQGVATVRELVGLIWEDPDARGRFIGILSKSRQVYSHSLNVCLLGVAFARSQGWTREQLDTLGVALFFHDLGLVEGALDEHGMLAADYFSRHEDMLEHPRRSVEFLRQLPGIAPVVLDVVLNHHEELAGGGYPRGLRAPDLNLGERLARIVDQYEAQTSGFGLPERISAFEVLRLMADDYGSKMDQGLIRKFIHFLGQA